MTNYNIKWLTITLNDDNDYGFSILSLKWLKTAVQNEWIIVSNTWIIITRTTLFIDWMMIMLSRSSTRLLTGWWYCSLDLVHFYWLDDDIAG